MKQCYLRIQFNIFCLMIKAPKYMTRQGRFPLKLRALFRYLNTHLHTWLIHFRMLNIMWFQVYSFSISWRKLLTELFSPFFAPSEFLSRWAVIHSSSQSLICCQLCEVWVASSFLAYLFIYLFNQVHYSSFNSIS